MSEEGCGIPLPGDIQKSSEHVWAPACIWTCISGTRQPPGVISLTPQPLSDSVMCNFLSGTCRGICSPELQKNRPESPSEQTSEHLCVTYKLNSKETLSSGPVFLWLKYLYQFGIYRCSRVQQIISKAEQGQFQILPGSSPSPHSLYSNISA